MTGFMRRWSGLLLTSVLGMFCGCANDGHAVQDNPQVAPGTKLQDVTFRSSALNREMKYRVILPEAIAASQKLSVVYLLHGGGGGFRDWSNYSDVAKYANKGLILVMPEGNSSYYTNSATVPADRYEDYIVKDLIADVESRFPAASSRGRRAIAGVSMGGFGAIKIALKHPQLFIIAGGLSPAVDVPTRPFSVKRIAQWKFHRSVFGPSGSQTRLENDPYALAKEADPKTTPYLFLTCGEREGLLAANRKLARLLKERGFRYEFVTQMGDHNWEQWDKQVPGLFDRVLAQLEH
jgi:putative tributyrin esterase